MLSRKYKSENKFKINYQGIRCMCVNKQVISGQDCMHSWIHSSQSNFEPLKCMKYNVQYEQLQKWVFKQKIAPSVVSKSILKWGVVEFASVFTSE